MSRKILKTILAIIVICVVWFALFGIRLVGYISTVNERDIRQTACGTQGCGNVELFFNLAWTVFFMIILTLIVPISISIYSLLIDKKKSKST
jgi:hypothetical protein